MLFLHFSFFNSKGRLYIFIRLCGFCIKSLCLAMHSSGLSSNLSKGKKALCLNLRYSVAVGLIVGFEVAMS